MAEIVSETNIVHATDILFVSGKGSCRHAAQVIWQNIVRDVVGDDPYSVKASRRKELTGEAFTRLNEQLPDYRILVEHDKEKKLLQVVKGYDKLESSIWNRLKQKKYNDIDKLKKEEEKKMLKMMKKDSMYLDFVRFRKWKFSREDRKAVLAIPDERVEMFEEYFEFRKWENVKQFELLKEVDVNKSNETKEDTELIQSSKKKKRRSKRKHSKSPSPNDNNDNDDGALHDNSMNVPKIPTRKSRTLTIDYLEESDDDTNKDDIISVYTSKRDNDIEDEDVMQKSSNADEDDNDDNNIDDEDVMPKSSNADEDDKDDNDIEDEDVMPKSSNTDEDDKDDNKINKSITSFESATSENRINVSEGVSNSKVIVLEDNLTLETGAWGLVIGSGKPNIDEEKDEEDEQKTEIDEDDTDEDDESKNQELLKSSRKQSCPKKLNVPSNSWVDKQNRQRAIAIANNTQQLTFKNSHLFPTERDAFGMKIMNSPYCLKENESTLPVDRTWGYNKLKQMLNLREADVPGDGNCAIAAMLAVINDMKKFDENNKEMPKSNYCVHDKTIMKFRKFISYGYMNMMLNENLSEWGKQETFRYTQLILNDDYPFTNWWTKELEMAYKSDDTKNENLDESFWFETEVHFFTFAYLLKKSVVIFQKDVISTDKGKEKFSNKGKMAYIRYDPTFPHILPCYEFNDLDSNKPVRGTFNIDVENTFFFVHETGKHYDALVHDMKTVKNIKDPIGMNYTPYTKITGEDKFFVSDASFEHTTDLYIKLYEKISNKSKFLLRKPVKSTDKIKTSTDSGTNKDYTSVDNVDNQTGNSTKSKPKRRCTNDDPNKESRKQCKKKKSKRGQKHNHINLRESGDKDP